MTVEPPLSRRIEELAGYDDAEPDAAGLGSTLAALRGEVTAVRSELGSLRTELGSVRADVRRTVTGALDSDARSAAGTQAALVDARGVLESRLAVLEDTLDLMVERLESLARDGARTTTDRLTELLSGMRRLEGRVEQLGGEQVESVATRLAELVEARTSAVAERLEGGPRPGPADAGPPVTAGPLRLFRRRRS